MWMLYTSWREYLGQILLEISYDEASFYIIQIFWLVIKLYVKINKHVNLMVIPPTKYSHSTMLMCPCLHVSTLSLYTQWGDTALSRAKSGTTASYNSESQCQGCREIIKLLEAAAATSREGSEVRDVYSR